jgi:hypothetical protein
MAATVEAVKETKNAKYRIIAEEVKSRPGCWNLSAVKIFLITPTEQKQIGEYTRNYPSFALETFLPFSQGDRDYALYSRDYTSTRVMDLPSCRDIGGEEPNAAGFCPVAYCVPEILTSDNAERESTIGLVAGCIWGDDSSWKLQCLDLSEVKRGVLKRDERFGYLELPKEIPLEKAVLGLREITVGDGSAIQFRVAGIHTFNLLTGKPLPYDPFE